MAKYTIEFKLEVLKHYEKYGYNDTCRVYNISKTALEQWRMRWESGNLMRKKNQTYSLQEKLEILSYYRAEGIIETEAKYNINRGVVHQWEKKLLEYGEEALARDGRKKPKGPKKDLTKNEEIMDELQKLRIENMYLKKLQALIKERKDRENKRK